MKERILLFAFLFVLGACQSPQKQSQVSHKPLPTTIEEAVASPYRRDENRARDVYRHPVETLQFFGLTPEMTVVEITPGAGWYMEILAPLVASKGKYIAALPPSNSEYMARLNEKVQKWIDSHPELTGKIHTTTFNPPEDIAPEGTVDMVLTFRNVHNWMARGNAQEAFNAFYKALKPGGILGVVEHRANPKSRRDPKAKSGYVHEAEVIQMAQKAGFKLVAKSEVNANPKDTKNHPEGVWTLPPTLRLGEKDKEKYLAIGESDRMTLKFIKPQ